VLALNASEVEDSRLLGHGLFQLEDVKRGRWNPSSLGAAEIHHHFLSVKIITFFSSLKT